MSHIDHAAHMHNAGRHSSITNVTACLQVTTEAEFDSAIRSHERESLCWMPPKWPCAVFQSYLLLQFNRCSPACLELHDAKAKYPSSMTTRVMTVLRCSGGCRLHGEVVSQVHLPQAQA